jgi:uncharacterized protein
MKDLQQHSLSTSIFLHLFPGIIITIVYALLVQPLKHVGLPALFTIYLCIPFVLIPLELGFLLYIARRHKRNLKDIIAYKQPISKKQFIFFVILLLLLSSLSVIISANSDTYIIKTFFAWIPSWFFFVEDFTIYSQNTLKMMLIVGFIFNGVIGPVVEELYFRGYLLPRVSRFGWWAPFINTVLFSVYHFFTPWQNIGRIIGLLPLVYTVFGKKNIYIGMTVHVLGNMLSMIGLLSLLK